MSCMAIIINVLIISKLSGLEVPARYVEICIFTGKEEQVKMPEAGLQCRLACSKEDCKSWMT